MLYLPYSFRLLVSVSKDVFERIENQIPAPSIGVFSRPVS